MDITVSTSQIIAFCGAVITINGAIAVFISWLAKVQNPNKLQDARLDNIELRLKKHDELLQKDLIRFESLENGNKIILTSLLALLKHGIDGNNIDTLRSAETELTRFLVEGK